MRGGITMSMNLAPLKHLAKKSPEHFRKAMGAGAIQFLNWANNGSARQSRKPPIRWGFLRGSASAFVEGKLITIAPPASGGSSGDAPLTTYKGEKNTISWIWNARYAWRMHEHKGNWGPATLADGDAGNKWLELHLKSDKEDLMKVIAKEFKRFAGT